MCGIFGAVQIGKGNLTIASIKEMAVGQERRGPHAFGVAWIDADNRVHHFKSDGKVSDNLDIFDRMLGARAIIGHTRWATHGNPEDNVNNHPHPADGGWYVHNGQIPNHDDLTDEFDLLRSTDCDSEVLGLLVQHLDGTLKNRVVDTVNLCDTTYPLNMAGIWSRPARCVVVKRGNPLVMGKGSTGNIYFASLKVGVPGQIINTPDNTIWMFDLASKNTTEDLDALMPCEKKRGAKIVGSTFEEDNNDGGDGNTHHRVTISWDNNEEDPFEEIEDDVLTQMEMDEELEAMTKVRTKLSPSRQQALDAVNARAGAGLFDGQQYVNGRKARVIKVNKEVMKKRKAERKARKQARKAKRKK